MKLSLLPAVLLCVACGQSFMPGKPDLPASVSPGWLQKSYGPAEPPEGLPGGPAPQCWKATYRGTGVAEVWACAWRTPGSAFNAEQRANVGPDAVKFQAGGYLVVVKWRGAGRVEVTALIRAIQKTLQHAG